MKEKIISIRGAFDDIVDGWYLKRIIPDEALDSLKNASKKLGEILPKVEQGIAQGMQDLEKKFSKALDEYSGELAHVGITSVPNKVRADQLKAPKGNELKGAKAVYEGVSNVDPNSINKLNDIKRTVKVSSNGKVIVQHGKNAGSEKTIILYKNAGKIETRKGVTLARDMNGFPIFNSKFDTHIPNYHLGNKDPGSHFKYSNERLRELLQNNPDTAKEMGLTNIQLKHFLKDPASKRPPAGLTWHHHQDTGRMQLVALKEHDAFVPHTGGMSIWGGGYGK